MKKRKQQNHLLLLLLFQLLILSHLPSFLSFHYFNYFSFIFQLFFSFFSFSSLLHKIKGKECVILLVVDILDFTPNLVEAIHKIVRNDQNKRNHQNPIVLAVNKIDLLPPV